MGHNRPTILGLFAGDAQAAAAVAKLRETDFILERVHSPFPSHALAEAMPLPKSKVGWFTLTGAVIGFLTGFWLAAFTAGRWNLIVGGKPVFAWIPFVIVGFEFTILLAVFGNVVGLITQARLPRLGTLIPYHARLSGDRFGVAASCPVGEEDKLTRLFKDLGAEIAQAVDQEVLRP